METILEQQRRYHEERERLIKLMVDEYATKKVSVSWNKKKTSNFGYFVILQFLTKIR